MMVLGLIFGLYVLKFLSNLLQQGVQALTSSTITQLLLTEDYQPLRVLESEIPKSHIVSRNQDTSKVKRPWKKQTNNHTKPTFFSLPYSDPPNSTKALRNHC